MPPDRQRRARADGFTPLGEVVHTATSARGVLEVRGQRTKPLTGAGTNSRCLDVVPSEAPELERGVVTTALAPAPALTAADRCDRCGAQAYVRVRLVSGGELLFCGHHARKHLPALRDLAADIQDESDRLDPTPATATDDEH